MPISFLSMQRDSEQDNGHSSGLDQKRNGFLHEYTPQGECDRVAEKMLTFAESRHPIFRSTSPLSRRVLKSKGCGKLSNHFSAFGDTAETVFRTIISVNQQSIYWAVSDLCDEYRICQARTVRPVLAELCDPLFEPASLLMKTPTPSTEDPAQEDLLRKYQNGETRWQSSPSFVPSVIKTNILLNDDPANEFVLQRDRERNEKVITTRQIEQVLYWCRIPDFSWSRTVFHDERHWRNLTIHRFSGLSWVHFAKRWKLFWTNSLDQREHQNWALVGSYKLLLTR